MTLVGEVCVAVQVDDGCIRGLRVTSSRPDVARTLLNGRPVQAVQAAVPALFAVCGTSQSVACHLALAAACGHAVASTLAAGPASVAIETLCETACQVLLRWPTWLGERPSPSAVAAARALMLHSLERSSPPAPVREACAQTVFGCGAEAWLALPDWPAVLGWATHGGTPAARVLASMLGVDDAAGHHHRATGLLPPADADLALPLARLALADPAYSARPTWQGLAAETGARARLFKDPLMHQRAGRPGSPMALRLAARLRELASLLDGRHESAAGCATLDSGVGVGWVENARGLLLHVARVQGDRVLDYRIVAPTEWNLHPQGALARDLLDTPVHSPEEALARATRSVRSLDPCVAWTVELAHA
jgi:hypothetical protein